MVSLVRLRRQWIAALLAAGLLLMLALILALPARAQTTVDVSAENNFFSPSVINIEVGDVVRWTNNGGGLHNVSSTTPSMPYRCANGCDGDGGNGDPASNTWTASVTFNTAGNFTYICEIHGGSGMTGTINVTEPLAVSLRSLVADASDGTGKLAAVLLLIAFSLPSLYLVSRRPGQRDRDR